MNWSELTQDIYNNHGPRAPILIGVHPSYGSGGQLVSREMWDVYSDGFISAWTSHVGPRVLIPANRNTDYFLASYPDYEITCFPNGTSAVRFQLIKLAGSTAKKGMFGTGGCVDQVRSKLVNGGFTKNAKIIREATLFV